MTAALGETERLREQIEALRKSIHGCAGNAAVSSVAGPPFRYAMDALYLIDGMAERLARVEADAERYRFMRDNDLGDAAWNILCGHQGDELDEAVDKAIRAGK